MELIALHQVATRERAGGPRIVIPAGRQFDTIDYPMISDAEWQAMMSGSPQIVRTPDDSAFVVPQGPVIASQAAAAVSRGPTAEDDDDKLARVPRRVRRAPVADDDDDEV